ncbi:MAG: MopE-related protein, partial [Chitinophagales bacterium]|nr:MopE-related protein [Chitinophagales bacterium]
PLQVTMASFLSCYCIPVYSTGSGFGDYINSVVLNGSGSNVINNVTGPNPSPYYTYYPPSPTTTTTLEQGCTYTLNVQVGTYAYNDVAAWIDFNQDGVLSASEKIGEVYNIPASAVASFTFTVPVSATLGVTRLRIREADQGTTSLDPCVTYTWGETEDYDVTIAAPTNVWYADNDGDGYGDPTNTTTACTPPPGYVADNTDCNDADAAVNPGAAEICNGMDDDCDGLVDDADPSVSGTSTWYADADGDGYGDASMSTMACVAPSGYVADNTDCNDGDAAINPGAAEVCNGIDDDCDGTADDGLTFTTYYVDADGDGYGDASDPGVSLCADPGAGYSTNNTDCNDGDPAVNPGAVDVCSNGVDDNCDGNVDENDVTVSLSPAGPITACHGTPVSLTATASGSGTMSYIWYRGLNVIPETSSSHTTTKKGTFWVVATNGLCSGVSNFVNISRIPSPPANITNLSGTNELCTSITLKANGTAYTYEWFKDGVSTGVTSKFYTVTATGNYTVKVTNSNGCTKESAVESIVPCPVRSTLVADASFSLYPNPTDGNQVFLSGRMGSDEPVTITVSTLLGQEVLRVVVNSEGGLLQTTLSLPADLASGTYVVKLVSGSSTITRNLVVQR